MSAVLNFQQQLTTETCYKCGIVFAVPNYFKTSRLRDKESFYCPNGHSQAYVESEADRLRKQLEQERNRVEFHKRETEQAKRELHGANTQLSKTWNTLARTKARVSKGVCPCCNRTFINVQRHMATKHPDYAGVEEPTSV